MERTKDYSYGIIPVCKTEGGLKFLVILHHSCHWSFPKGHKENDESDLETALRELREETGISECVVVNDVSFSERYEWTRGEVPLDKTVKFFVGWIKNSNVTILQSEIKDFRWASVEEALELLTYPEMIGLFKQVINYLKENADR